MTRTAARNLVIAASIAILACLVFWPGTRGGFLFDDYPNLVDDPSWQVDDWTPDSMRSVVRGGFSGTGGRPLAMLTFAANHVHAGPDIDAMKATNIALHAGNAVLMFLLVLALLDRLGERCGDARVRTATAAMVAAAWALHPMHASTVLYTVQRMEIGAASGVLLALLAYLRARVPHTRAGLRVLLGGAAILSCMAGLGFKETALLAPGFALAMELVVLRFRGDDGTRSRRLVAAWGLLCLLGVAAFAYIAMPYLAPGGRYDMRGFTAVERVLTQSRVLVVYLGQSLLPTPGSFPFYYDWIAVSRSILSPVGTLWSTLLLGALVAVAAWCRDRLPLVALGILWYFVGHALTSNVIPLELAFEHRNYFPLLGVLIAVAGVLVPGAIRLGLRLRLVAAIASLAIVFLAAMTFLQSSTWGNPLSLSRALAERAPLSVRASFEYGKALMMQSGPTADAPPGSPARGWFERALALDSPSPLPEQALIVLDASHGRTVAPALWQRLDAKIAGRAAGPEVETTLWQLVECRRSRRCDFDDAALAHLLETATARNARSPLMHSLHAEFAYTVVGDHRRGIDLMRQATLLAPGDLRFRANLARYLAAAGEHTPELDALVAAIAAANVRGDYDEDLRVIAALRAPRPPAAE